MKSRSLDGKKWDDIMSSKKEKIDQDPFRFIFQDLLVTSSLPRTIIHHTKRIFRGSYSVCPRVSSMVTDRRGTWGFPPKGLPSYVKVGYSRVHRRVIQGFMLQSH